MNRTWIFFIGILFSTAVYIYLIYYAFTNLALWLGVVSVVVPVIGNMLVCGAAIALGDWMPIILASTAGIVYYGSAYLASRGDEA